jgi:hypothetical protein
MKIDDFIRVNLLYSFIGMAICWAIVSITWQLSTMQSISPLGHLAAIAAFIPFAVIALGMTVVSFYSLVYAFSVLGERKLFQKYPNVYLVCSLPNANHVLKATGSDVRVGDYGWEAEPLEENGLIYLHGLSADWNVQWYAGFTSRQLTWVCIKPRLQYKLPYSWLIDPPTCPYVVQEAVPAARSLGRPFRNMGNWVQGRNLSKRDSNPP